MNTSPKVVCFDGDNLWVDLADGRTIATSLAWFPRLLQATPAQRGASVASVRGRFKTAISARLN